MIKLANISLFESLGSNCCDRLSVFNQTSTPDEYANNIDAISNWILSNKKNINNNNGWVLYYLREYYKDLWATIGKDEAMKVIGSIGESVNSKDSSLGRTIIQQIRKLFGKDIPKKYGTAVRESVLSDEYDPMIEYRIKPKRLTPSQLKKVEKNEGYRRKF